MIKNLKNHIVISDFDGTITTKDTLLEIAKFSTKPLAYFAKLVLFIPFMILMKSKVLSKQKGKEIFLKLFFSKLDRKNFNSLCVKFSEDRIPNLIRPKALSEIDQQISNGNKIVIVSASPENWIKPWADKLEIEVLATKLKFENDKLVGIDGANCNGEEKVRRIKESINLKEYQKVIAYGDTKGDYPMLALANEKHYKPFR